MATTPEVVSRASICRFCAANCPITVELHDGRPVKVTGNRNSPLYEGFCCPRGRATVEQLYSPERLLHPLKRSGGELRHQPVPVLQALDEIAAKLRSIIDQHGPSAVALYQGTYSVSNPASAPVSNAFMQALGSPMLFNTGTIDQPGKHMAAGLMGTWEAGVHPFAGADVWMLIGSNPLVSIGITIPAQNPGGKLNRALKRGMKLIVIDPRRTETASHASLHLQSRPGEDASLLAAMLRVVLSEGLHDEDFCRENVDGLALLRQAVEPFTPEYAAARADVPAAKIIEAARIFATAKRGLAVGSTGANMSGRSTLTEYLILCLNTVCGRYLREGEAVTNPGVLIGRAAPKAQPRQRQPAVFPDLKLSVRGLSMCSMGMPTAALADEILNGKIRALITLGGNPAVAMPDQNRSIAALETLELFVQTDIRMSASAKLAHYVIPPPVSLEAAHMSYSTEFLDVIYDGWGLGAPFGMYAPKLVDPPPGAELLPEWELFYELARRLGLQLTLRDVAPINSSSRSIRAPIALDMQRKPTLDEMFELLTQGSRIPLVEVKQHPDGAMFPEEIRVAAKDPSCDLRLEIADATMLEELAEVFGIAASTQSTAFPYVFIGRRMPHVYNSSGRDLPLLVRLRGTYNAAYLHPQDLSALGLTAGDSVQIASAHGSIHAVVEPDDSLRRGLVSMSHSFGDIPRDSKDFRRVGSNTSQLTSCEEDYDRYSGIPRMSAVPVRVTALPKECADGKTEPELNSVGQ